MKQRRARNRECHTRPGKGKELVPVRLMLPRSTVDEMHQMTQTQKVSREEIFLIGLAYCKGS